MKESTQAKLDRLMIRWVQECFDEVCDVFLAEDWLKVCELSMGVDFLRNDSRVKDMVRVSKVMLKGDNL